MIRSIDLGFVAGLAEGEAWFGWTGAHKPYRGSATIQIGMNDADVIARVATLWGRPYWQRKRTKLPKNPHFVVQVLGAEAIGWMMTLFPLLGLRRRRRIAAIIADWKSQTRSKVTP